VSIGGLDNQRKYGDKDFDRLSLHDCALWGVSWRVGDPGEGDWTSDLVLDLDYIAEWLCGVDDRAQFKVAPAQLVFHGVTDPQLALDWGQRGFQVAPYEVTIDRIERTPVANQKIFRERPYYEWRISFHSPVQGHVSFGAVDFTLTLLSEPVLTHKQRLSLGERNSLLASRR
jgi:hypothetical protein